MNEEKQMDGARLSVTDHKQREKEGEGEQWESLRGNSRKGDLVGGRKKKHNVTKGLRRTEQRVKGGTVRWLKVDKR